MAGPLRRILVVLTLAAAFAQAGEAAQQVKADDVDIELFFRAGAMDETALAQIADNWRDGYAAMLIDEVDLMRRTSLVNPMAWITITQLFSFLEERTGQKFGTVLPRWRDWLWSRPYDPHPEYGVFKGRLYAQLDPRFEEFFLAPAKSVIRLDEVDWGGVAVNGIPPLDYPANVRAADAAYMADSNIVFGVYLDGVARAYPKRILAWHEMARDRVGTLEVTLVYCTLCGTVIPYDSQVGGKVRTFGTSGLLYQSNKLMFDDETKSLWSSLDGTPVVGPLVGSGLRLSVWPVVTTTWGEWRRMHPDTTVLSLDTGFRRDYSEGAAYRQYFSTDSLMFGVSKTDRRLANKAEVLVLRLGAPSATAAPVAIAAEFLRANRVYHLDEADRHLVVVTSGAGANRVYEAGARRFGPSDAAGRVADADGREWIVEENQLQAAFDTTLRLPRVPAHRAFWFAWYAQHPDTRLIK